MSLPALISAKATTALSAAPSATDPAPAGGGGFLNLDPLSTDGLNIIKLILYVVAGFVIYSAIKGKWGRALTTFGLTLVGLVILGLSGKVGTGTSGFADKVLALIGIA